jgi:hypothetical protein
MCHFKQNKLASLLTFFLLSLFVLSCGKDDDDAPEDPSTAETKKGFGDSEERPVGDSFSLPANIVLKDKLYGYSIFTSEFCDNKTEDDAIGMGTLVQICVPFFNNSNSNGNPGSIIKVTLPAGHVYISNNINTQKGILIKKVTVEVTPGKTLYIPLFLFCLNASRSGSAPGDVFEMGPVTKDKDMLNLIALLQNKKLDPKDYELAAFLQAAVWDASEGKPLTQEQKNRIAALADE